MRLLGCAVLSGLMLACAAGGAPPVSDALKAELAPGGVLRAGINYSNPLLASRDVATGELSGVAVDITRELGRRVGLEVELIPFESAGRISSAVTAGAWDIAYLAIDPARAEDIDFTAAYLEVEGTYMVPDISPLRRIEDVDQPGVRVVVTRGSAYDLFLSRTLTSAQLVRDATSTPESLDLFFREEMDAVAAIRTALETAAERNPGYRVMDGRFMTIPQAAGVPRGRDLAAAYVRDFIEDVKASGFVLDALTRQGLEGEAAIAAPAGQAR